MHSEEIIRIEYPHEGFQDGWPGEVFLSGCGIARSSDPHGHGPVADNVESLCFVLSGRGTLRCGERDHPLGRDDIFWAPSGERVSCKAEPQKPWHWAWVSFGGTRARDYLGYAGFQTDRPVQRSRVATDGYLNRIQALAQSREDTAAGELDRVSQLLRLLSTLIRNQQMDSRVSGTPDNYPREIYVQSARDFIAQHYGHARVGDVARFIGINRTYLNSIFKKVLGVTPQEYLLEYRLQRAKELLLTTALGLREIGERVGYEDPFTFSRMFKGRVGAPPRDYRRTGGRGVEQDE